MSISHVKNIAVIGATGNLGSLVIKHLIAANQFNITAISRSSSSPSPFLTSSANLTHITGDYNSPTFLSTIFKDIEAVILTLHHSAVPDLEIQFIEAAAASGVKWILPTEFGSDTANEELVSSIPILGQKTAPRKKIEELSEKYEGLKWIGIVNNPWFDFVSLSILRVKKRVVAN